MTEHLSAAVAASVASGGVESVEFLNDIVKQLWDYVNVAGSKMTKDIVEPMFEDMLPGPLKSLHFTKIDLGKVPIRFDNIDVHSRQEGVIKLDIDVIWDGKSDIELRANLIGGLGVEHVKLKGRLSVLLCPLVERMPLVTAMQIAFVNPPHLELDFTGLAQVADLSIIDDTIRKVIQDILASMLVLPNRFLVKIDPANDYFKTYQQHLGFLRLTIVNGKGFSTPTGWFKDIPDTYCQVKVGATKAWRTSTKKNSTSPQWHEMKDFLLSDHDQKIEISVSDDDLAGDDDLGSGSMTVGELLLAGSIADVPLHVNKRDTGAKISIKCDVHQFVSDLASLESPGNEKDGLYSGILTILVAYATNIPGARDKIRPHCKVTFGDQKFDTPTVADNPGMDPNNPAFDSAFRVLLDAKLATQQSDINLTLMDYKEKLGTVTIPWSDVVRAPQATLTDRFKLGNGAAIHARVSICGTKLVVN